MGGVKLLQIILIVILVGVMFYLLRLYRTLKIEKRIAKFALNSIKNEDLSIIDNIIYVIGILIKKLSLVLNKSVVINKYSNKYNKYILYEDRDKIQGIDYISAKFLFAIFILILGLFTFIFKKTPIDLMILLLIFIVSFVVPDIFLNILFNKKRKRVEEDLLKAIIIMNNAFQSGRNIMQAIECVKSELDGPIQDEFKKIYLDITYGLSLDVVFNRFYERIKLEDAKYITSSLTLLNKTGGDIVKVFSMIEKSFFDKKNLKNELKSLTASSRFVFKLLVFLPVVFVLIIFILNPLYFKPLVASALGIIVLTFTILLYILYILVIKKVLEVEI